MAYEEEIKPFYIRFLNKIENGSPAEIQEAARKFQERCGEFGVDYTKSANGYLLVIAHKFEDAISTTMHPDHKNDSRNTVQITDCMRDTMEMLGLGKWASDRIVQRAHAFIDQIHTV